MTIIFNILEFLIFIKLFLFWLWLWQLKEYHWGRFLAHFEAQKIKKFLSSFWRLKHPQFTKKVISIFLSGILLAIWWFSFFSGTFLIILAPLFTSLLVLLFQIPTIFWRKILIKRAKEKREQFKNLLVIGITGSYGKTSTKEFLATILSKKFNVLKTKKNQNSEVGIAQCILKDLKPEHEIFVVEMGAYNRGGIKLLADIAQPKIGILTGINEQHMATFGSQDNIIKTKYELIESLPEDGLSIFNGENFYCLELYKRTKKTKRICHSVSLALERGLEPDIWAADVEVEKNSLSFKVFSKEGSFRDFKVNLSGGHNISNILAGVSCAKELSMNLEEISEACQEIRPEQGAMKILKGINGINLIDSTYSANPTGVMAVLEYLELWPGKKTIVMPCLIELGKASKDVHQRIGKKIGEVCDLAIIITKDYFKEIRKKAVEAGLEEENIILLEQPVKILEKIKGFSGPGDVVLFEGRVPKQLIKKLTP